MQEEKQALLSELCDVPAPAKINLFLHVLGRREDGYHRLQTVFQFLDYSDRLTFRVRDDGSIHRLDELPGVPEANDLTVKAARLLQQAAVTDKGADIGIRKVLPMGGGLGGGSSDAATTLVALNQLWQTGLPRTALARLGLQIGADVPFFIFGHAAWAEGVGEQLRALDPVEPWYLIIVPDCQVSTAAVFADPQLTRDCSPITINDFISGRCVNVCEAVVRRHYPPVAAALDWLEQFSPAHMSGTGSCVFAAFDDQQSAQDVLDMLPDPAWRGFVARGLNCSPLTAGFHEQG